MWSRIQYKRYRWSRQIRSVRNQILRRKRLNFPKKNAEEIARLSDQALPITMVTSFPRSGNTWMRMMLSDVFASLSPMEQSCDQTRNNWLASNDLIPDIYHNDIASRHHLMHAGGELAERFGVFVKTHEDFEQLDRLGPYRFENAKKSEGRRNENRDLNFFRRGKSGGGREELSAKTLRSIQLQTADLVEQAVERSNVAIVKRAQNRAQADQAA